MKKLTLFSTLIMSGLLVACGGSDPSNKPDTLFPEGFVPAPPPVAGSDDNIVNTPLPLFENFNDAVDIGSFFSATYKPLATDNPDDPAPAFYYPTCCLYDDDGNVQENSFWISETEDKKLRFGNARFTIGQTLSELAGDASDPKINTTSALVTDSWGELDLSRPYKVSFCVVQTGGSENMLIFVDNNTSSEANSKWGGGTGGSPIFKQNVDSLIPGKRVTINIPGETKFSPEGASVLTINNQVGEKNSFLQVRVGSGGYAIIDDFLIEYQDETSIEPAAETCVADPNLQAPPPKTAPAAPQKPIASGGDQQITVSWSAVTSAASYEVYYSTTNVAEGASPFEGNPVTGTTAVITGLTNDIPYYVFVRAANTVGVSDYSESVSVTPELPPVTQPEDILVAEDFSAIDTDTFMSAAYKSLPGNPTLPLYVATSGGSRISFVDGAINMNNARFTIGDNSGGTDTAAETQPDGTLDLSRPYRISFKVLAVEGMGNFQLYVDNNTTSSSKSLHGGDSRVLQLTPADITSFPHQVVLEPSIGTATSFLQIRADSSITNLVIDDLVIEYLEDKGLVSEDFSALDVDTFTSAVYKTLPNDPVLPLYVATSGSSRITFTDGALSMNNARFTIGDKAAGTDTAAETQPNGDLDLTSPYRIRFNVLAAEGTGNFQVYVDNNTTSSSKSLHGGDSRLLQMTPAEISSFPYEVVIESDLGTVTSFFQIRADSSITNLTIDDLVIELQ